MVSPMPRFTLEPALRQTLLCRVCGVDLHSEKREEREQVIAFRGVAEGWRVCRCGQMVLKGRGRNKQILDPLAGDWHHADGPLGPKPTKRGP